MAYKKSIILPSYENPIKNIKTTFETPPSKDEIEKLTKNFAQYIGVKYVYPVSSFSAALLLSFYALDFNFHDQIALSSLNFPQIPGAIELFGCKPLFIDIDSSNYSINLSHLELMINNKLKAVLVSHLFGIPAEIDSLMEAASIYKFLVIEDVSTSLGAVYKGKKCGSFGNISIFNFDSSSLINCENGAIIATSDDKINQRLKIILNKGYDENNELKIPVPEFPMSYEKARLINEYLKHIDSLIDYKYIIAKYYRRELSIKDNIKFIEPNNYSLMTFNYLPIIVENNDLYNKINKIISNYDNTTKPVVLPMAYYYKKTYNLSETSYKNTINIFKNTLYLPNSFSITIETVEKIIKEIKAIL